MDCECGDETKSSRTPQDPLPHSTLSHHGQVLVIMEEMFGYLAMGERVP